MRGIRPRRLLAKIRMQARGFFCRLQGKQIIHFLHIGKTGGSAVKYALTKHLGNSAYCIFLHDHEFRLKDVPQGEKAFFFLRDPISRFVSGFYSRQRQGQPLYFSPWSSGETAAFEEFHTPNELALALSSPDRACMSRAHSAMNAIEHVRDRYEKWFETEEFMKARSKDIFFIGFQESLAEDFELLVAKIGLPAGTALPTGDVLSHRTPSDVDKALDYEAIVNLKAWYYDDFMFLRLASSLQDNLTSSRRIRTV